MHGLVISFSQAKNMNRPALRSRASGRWLAFIAIALLVCCIVTIALGEPDVLSGGEAEEGQAKEGEQLALEKDSEIKSKVFKFNQFKALFHKSYKTITEEVHRRTLYLASLLEMFTSYLKYRHKRASSFKAVNQMSDWTEDEFQNTLMDTQAYLKAMRADEFDFGQDSEFEIEEVHDNAEQPEKSTRATFLELLQNDAEDQQRSELAGRLERSNAIRWDHNFDESEAPELENELELEIDDNDDDDASRPESNSGGDSEKGSDSKKKTTIGKRIKNLGKKISDGSEKVLSAVDGLIQDTFHKVYTRKHEYRPDLPDEVFVDYRKSGCLTPIKSQGVCGSCYIFSTLALYEWAYCKREGQQVQFSEQYVVDCGPKLNLHGCRGGAESQVSRFVSKFGLELSERYKYEDKEQECPYDSAKMPAQAMGFVHVDRPQLTLLMSNSFEKQLEISPLLVSIYLSDIFRQYGGGIDDGKGCGKHRLRMHAVLLVGHGRKDGHEYWIIRNSHGHWFGDRGYYKVRKDSKCLTDFGAGHMLKVLKGANKGQKSRSKDSLTLLDSPNKGVDEKQPPQVEYKFFENPKYDWKILAQRFEMAPQTPPTLPKKKPVDSKPPFWPADQ